MTETETKLDAGTATLEGIYEAAEALAQEEPDFTYTQGGGDYCYYTTDSHRELVATEEEPRVGCLIGQAMVRAGVPLAVLRGVDDEPEGVVLGASTLLRHMFPDATGGAGQALIYALDAAQGAQDGGLTWSKAMDTAAVAKTL